MNQNQIKATSVVQEIKKMIIGKDECIMKAFAAILAGGHILIEDVPGVGKTTLAVAFSKALGLDNKRVQFTPDVLPADILGFSMYQKDKGIFEYHEGAIMCNLFLADEINRTSPKTQSALLEVMEEGKATVDGITRELPDPFIVMATQNPKGSAGTQLLPESQLDRFMISMSMGYPNIINEIEIAKGKAGSSCVQDINNVITTKELLLIKKEVESVYIYDHIYSYIAKLISATRDNQYIELGVSPRGTIALARMSKAWAYLQGRDFVIPHDVIDVYMDVAKHRIVLNTKARVSKVKVEAVLEDIVEHTKQPASYMERAEYRA